MGDMLNVGTEKTQKWPYANNSIKFEESSIGMMYTFDNFQDFLAGETLQEQVIIFTFIKSGIDSTLFLRIINFFLSTEAVIMFIYNISYSCSSFITCLFAQRL